MAAIGTHIVWDWNGTLFHDIDVVVAASNASFTAVGLEPLSVRRYRELFCVPIRDFHRKVLGRPPTEEEWRLMNEVFQREYTARRAACGLAAGARELLRGWRAGGRSQSLLSLYAHDELLPLVGRLGIAEEFVRVDGSVGAFTGESKAEHLARHLLDLGRAAAGTVVIGDSADDARAALSVGARAVLYTGGSHARESLEAVGVPVVDSLAEAVAWAAGAAG
ncbi:HAD family hydrolase [Phaeacidiphilus oryzae]|uniref:HAD family hydrolase n=1 Tax=Phaeacidiphilus oryzae TaxID=348818 RepID=UPI000569CFEF|nr:HAD hydrolase-like protein [Phaeacidiphilus oryzae]